MLLNKLTLENFRQYYGKHEIEFSTNAKKNVTIIHAENSVGKTTMLNSITWCLYGNTPDFSSSDLVSWNHDGDTCSVKLNFVYDDNEFSVSRVYDKKRRKTKELNLYKIEYGNSVLQEEPVSMINHLLPENLSKYFFFSGENFGGMLSSETKSGYKDSIHEILGFNLPKTALKDLKKLNEKNTKEKNKLLRLQKSTENFAFQLDEKQKSLKEVKLNIESIASDLKSYKSIQREYSQKIADSNHEKAGDLSKEKQVKEMYKREKIAIREGLHQNKHDFIFKYGAAIFSRRLTSRGLDFLNKNDDGDVDDDIVRVPAPYDKGFVNRLLNRGSCICKRPLIKGKIEYENVQYLLHTANTAIIDDRVYKAKMVKDNSDGLAEEFLSELARVEVELSTVDNQIGVYELAIKDIEKRIDALGNVDISSWQKVSITATSDIAEANRKLGSKEAYEVSLKREIASIEREIGRVKMDTPELDQSLKYQETIEKLISYIKRALEKEEKNTVNLIFNSVQKILDNSLRRPFDIGRDEDYNFYQIERTTGSIIKGTDAGKGQTLLLNLAFVTALIGHLKLRASSKSEIFQPGTIAPFIIDAPFAEMDSSYQKATLSFLPEQSSQLVLFLSSGQWKEEYKEIIGKYVGKRYYLVNHSESTDEKDIEILKDGNQEYRLTELNSEHIFTSIKEIK